MTGSHMNMLKIGGMCQHRGTVVTHFVDLLRSKKISDVWELCKVSKKCELRAAVHVACNYST